MSKTKLEAMAVTAAGTDLTPLHPAQEALDRAEAQEIRLTETLAESETALREAEHRLERVRGVVRAAGVEYDSPHLESHLCEECEDDPVLVITLESHEATMNAYHALTPEDRVWAEGES